MAKPVEIGTGRRRAAPVWVQAKRRGGPCLFFSWLKTLSAPEYRAQAAPFFELPCVAKWLSPVLARLSMAGALGSPPPSPY